MRLHTDRLERAALRPRSSVHISELLTLVAVPAAYR